MSDNPNIPAPSRVYSEEEVAQLLKRATELQRTDMQRDGGEGMTLAELESIAVEAGIDPAHLRRAASDLEHSAGPDGLAARVFGEDLAITRETFLAGEVPEPAFEKLVGLIQSHIHDQGQMSWLGKTVSWHGGVNQNTRLSAVVSARDGRTHIRVEAQMGQLAGGLFGGILGGVGGGVGLGLGIPLGLGLGMPLLAVGFPLGVIGLAYSGTRALYRRVAKSRRKTVERLFSELEEAARAAIAASALHDPDTSS